MGNKDMKPDAITRRGRQRTVMIKCSKTGLPISTGIATGDNTDLISRYLKNKAHCPCVASRLAAIFLPPLSGGGHSRESVPVQPRDEVISRRCGLLPRHCRDRVRTKI
jgi:hypothetical protein